MIIDADVGVGDSYFFTAGNLPTQRAYGLTETDVANAFIVGLLRSERLLFAASYYFESSATRRLLDQFPGIWQDQSARSLFFINEGYPNFSDHGAGKLAKSPAVFSPYADSALVGLRGRRLDGIGIVGKRRDVDISAAIAKAWTTSCTSSHQDSLGSLFARYFPDRSEAVAAACSILASRSGLDFIWETIEPKVLDHPDLRLVAQELRRKLADLYATIMSKTLSATETSPSLAIDTRSVTQDSSGQLGLFWDVLRRLGLDLGSLHDEKLLMQVLNTDELNVFRQMHGLIIEAAVATHREVASYWEAVRIAEGRAEASELTHRQLGRVMKEVMLGLDLRPAPTLLSRMAGLESVFSTRLLPALRSRLESLQERPAARMKLRQQATGLVSNLLLCSADPPVASTIRPLDLGEEARSIGDAITAGRDAATITLRHRPNFRASELQEQLELWKPGYLHLSGHGTPTGHLFAFDASVERRSTLHSSTLAEAIRVHCPDLKCVYLNACYSQVAIEDLGPVVPYSVLIVDKVSDRLARVFAGAFYGAVAIGIGVPEAFRSAVNQSLLCDLDPAPVRLYEGTVLIASGDGKAEEAGIGKIIDAAIDPYL